MGGFQKGDYVLATKYDDGSPNDGWCVGVYDEHYPERIHKAHKVLFQTNGKEGFYCFTRVKRIRPEFGRLVVENIKLIEGYGYSVWYWYYHQKKLRQLAKNNRRSR